MDVMRLVRAFKKPVQFGQLYLIQGDPSFGKKFQIYVLPKYQATAICQRTARPINKGTVMVYGLLHGKPGLDECYGWLHKGAWVTDVEKIVLNREDELQAIDNLNKAKKRKLEMQQKALEEQTLSSYESSV